MTTNLSSDITSSYSIPFVFFFFFCLTPILLLAVFKRKKKTLARHILFLLTYDQISSCFSSYSKTKITTFLFLCFLFFILLLEIKEKKYRRLFRWSFCQCFFSCFVRCLFLVLGLFLGFIFLFQSSNCSFFFLLLLLSLWYSLKKYNNRALLCFTDVKKESNRLFNITD